MSNTTRIARGLRELGYTEFAVLGDQIVGIDNPPPLADILAASDARASRTAAALEAGEAMQQARVEAIEALLARAAQAPDAPKSVKDYAAARGR